MDSGAVGLLASDERFMRPHGEVSRLTPDCPDHRGLLGRAGSVRCPRTVDCWCVLQDSATTDAGGRRLGRAGSANRKRSAYVPVAVLCIWRTQGGWSVSQSFPSLSLSDATAQHHPPRFSASLLLMLSCWWCLCVCIVEAASRYLLSS